MANASMKSALGEDQGSVIEKRRSRRFAIDVAIKMKVKTSSGISTYCYGRGSNISEHGMAMFIAHELSIGQTVLITITLPYSERPIECKAKVRNRDSHRYGLEFIELGALDSELLTRTCRALSLVQ
jgi:hypothetical protein